MLPLPAITFLVTVGLFGTGVCQGPYYRPPINRGPFRPNPPPQSRGFCTLMESEQVFARCTEQFGLMHMQHFDYLAAQPVCRAELFSCPQVNTLVQCLNTLPNSIISMSCRRTLDTELTQSFRKHRIPCTFLDIEKHCGGQVAPLQHVTRMENYQQGPPQNTHRPRGPMRRPPGPPRWNGYGNARPGPPRNANYYPPPTRRSPSPFH